MMKSLFVVAKLLVGLALLLLALDWRSPLLADFRPWMLPGLIALSLGLIIAHARTLRAARPGQGVLKAVSWLGLLAATVALATTVVLETRFHGVRHQVFRADSGRLEKLGRHLVVGYRHLSEAQELVRLRAVAGVFVTARNVRGKTVARVRDEIQSLQDIRRQQGLPPLWIATDQEGGDVSRLSPPLTRLPSIPEIVARYPDMVQRERAVRNLARRQGRELASVGVNLNFAPVVDVRREKAIGFRDPFSQIFKRAISDDPSVVTQVAGWYCEALEEVGVRCTLKHFPGLGRVTADTHLSHGNLTAPVAELFNTDWRPFRELMRKSNCFTMLGHARLTAIDRDRPVSFSPPVIDGLLRGKWNHDGVLITDDFGMFAVYRSSSGIDVGSIDSLNAGVDLILLSYDCDQFYRVMHALLKADEEGRLKHKVLERSEQRLARAIQSRSARNGQRARNEHPAQVSIQRSGCETAIGLW